MFSLTPDLVIQPDTNLGLYFQGGAKPIGDVNGDGKMDYAFQMFSGSYCVSVFLGNYRYPSPKASGTRCRSSQGNSTFYWVTPVGDINGDGVNDFASSAPYDNYAGTLPQPGYFVIFSGNKNWLTDVEQNPNSPCPCEFELQQNYPNPFNPATTIPFFLPQTGFITLKVLDILGREIATLAQRNYMAGWHNIKFKGDNLPSGVYLYRLTANNYTITKKMLLVK